MPASYDYERAYAARHWLAGDAPRDSQYPYTMGFTPEWAPWLTANYQRMCRREEPCSYLGADYYAIMAAMRGRCRGEASDA